jgi:hypothetical protein
VPADEPDLVPGEPRFDVVLRGYDRRQVDAYVSRLQRIVAVMRSELGANESGRITDTPSGGTRPRPSPRPRPHPAADAGPDTIDSFTERMQSILQAAEEEAAEIRRQARRSVQADEEGLRRRLGELVRQRNIVLGDLNRLRSQIETMLSGSSARMPLAPPHGEQPPRSGQHPGPGGPPPFPAAVPPRSQPTRSAPIVRQPIVSQPVPPPAVPPPAVPPPAVPPPAVPPPAPTGDRLDEWPAEEPAAQPWPDAEPGAAMPAGAAPAEFGSGAPRSEERSEGPDSMRPRSGPAPEPGDLFRPRAQDRQGDEDREVLEARSGAEITAEAEALPTAGTAWPPEPVDAEPVDAERVDAERVDAEPVDAEPVGAERVDAERVDAEPVGAEPVDAEPVDAEPVDAEPVDAPSPRWQGTAGSPGVRPELRSDERAASPGAGDATADEEDPGDDRYPEPEGTDRPGDTGPGPVDGSPPGNGSLPANGAGHTADRASSARSG